MRGGGFRTCWSGLEQLETRALPSAVASVQISPLDVLDNHQGAIETGSSDASSPVGRALSTRSTENGKDDQAGVAKTGSGSGLSSATARTNSETGGGRPSRSQNTASREITPDPPVVSTRRLEEPGEVALDGNPLTSGQEAVSSQGGGAAIDPAEAVSLLGSSSGAAMPLQAANAIFPGSLVGPDVRLKVSVIDSTPLGTGGNFAAGLNVTEPASHGLQTSVAVHGEDSAPLDDALAASNRDALTRSGLMEGALHGDWDVIDREFRQFLSGLGGRLADETSGYGTGRLWPIGIGVAAALVLVRRAASRRGLFRSSIHVVLRVSDRRTLPSGPWPLGVR
jgi:hypothetical protein